MEKACLCALNRAFGFEPKTALALIDHLGSANAIFQLNSLEVDQLFGPYSRHKGKICSRALDEACTEIERLSRNGINFCGWTEDDYPPLLKECEDAPIGLYIKSDSPINELWKPRNIAIVGTRDISPYGKDLCRNLVQALSATTQKPTIVSGLALGTDIEAHRSAIEFGLPTIGVMATGPDTIYPSRHREFANRITGLSGCALVTDYPPGTAPLAVHFIRRNRIIAGLSNATVLVESKIKGGGMATCRLAFSYNRDVYALPGRIDDIRSQGCNELIRNRTAEPITNICSFLESLGMKQATRERHTDCRAILSGLPSDSIPEEHIERIRIILSEIMKERGITLSGLAERTGMNYRQVAEITGIMEAEGLISIDLLQRCSVKKRF